MARAIGAIGSETCTDNRHRRHKGQRHEPSAPSAPRHALATANGAIIVSIAIALLMLSPIMTAVLVLITIVIQILISTAADNRREALESKFVGRTGTAVGEINGKGLVDLEGEKINVISKKVIPAGARVKATGVMGSRIVVQPEEADQAEGDDLGV